MKNKKIKLFIIIILPVLAVIIFLAARSRFNAKSDVSVQEISPSTGSIQTFISTTGLVLPENRLEIKPPVAGRIESILVREGDYVKAGQTLAWMSSTERAALLDAARGQGEAQLKYWQDAYKPIALLAPIDGEVIVATTQPGQTVTASDAVIVLSDHLIVRAQVDETDIGKIKLGQNAIINLDAYPDTKIKARADHIYYESETVNNVTIYKVDLIPEETPSFFRSGMNATVNFIENDRQDVLLIPLEAVIKEGKDDFVLVKRGADKEPARQPVKLGLSDDKNAEVISGINANDKIIIKSRKFVLPTSDTGSNPFLPFRQRKKTNSSSR